MQHILGDSLAALVHADTSAGVNCSTVCWAFCYKDTSTAQGGSWGTGRVTCCHRRTATLQQAEAPTCAGAFSPAVVFSKKTLREKAAVQWQPAGKQRRSVLSAVGCHSSSCAAVSAELLETHLQPNAQCRKLNRHQDGLGLRILGPPPPCLPCLAFSGLVWGGSLVWWHNPHLIFITVDAKLLSAWSRRETRFLVVFSHLLSNFPWRFPCTNSTSRADSAAGEVVVGRFSLLVVLLQAIFCRECWSVTVEGFTWMDRLKVWQAASKGAREEAALDKHSFKIK